MTRMLVHAVAPSQEARHVVSNWHRGAEDAVATILGPGWPETAESRVTCKQGEKAFVPRCTNRWRPLGSRRRRRRAA